MNKEELLKCVQNIVTKSKELNDKYIDEIDAKAVYACVFCQSDEEHNHLVEVAKELGSIIKETPTGPFFNIHQMETVAGPIKLIKIRKYDENHLDLGHTDFTLENYEDFKNKYLRNGYFNLMKREDYEMIELIEKDSDVRAYFPNIPLDEYLGIK